MELLGVVDVLGGEKVLRRKIQSGLLYIGECGMVFHSASFSRQDSRLQLHCHKHLLWHFVFRVNTEPGRRREAKTRVIVGVSQYDHCSKTQLPTLLKT